MSSTLSVIVGRFQTPDLTEAHDALINAAFDAGDHVLILVGVIPSITKHDPLTFSQRAMMLQEHFYMRRHKLWCVPLAGHPDNKDWVRQVDTLIRCTATGRRVTMFWGPDSAHSIYKNFGGTYADDEHTAIIEHHPILHASTVRAGVKEEFSGAFRRGAVWQQNRQLAGVYPTVDCAIVTTGKTNDYPSILLGRKANDRPGLWRLPGGFVDPGDASLEIAARREAREETDGSLELGPATYIGSEKINDWRYRHGPEGILTSLFYIPYMWGSARAGDDLAEVKWWSLDQDSKIPIDTAHAGLLVRAANYVRNL